jgi:hypothetical protein
MTTTLPTPTHGAEYTNSVTGDKFKYDSDAGAWEGFEGIDRSGDSMTGTIAYPDMLINGNTLTADDNEDAHSNNTELAWIGYPTHEDRIDWHAITYGNGKFLSVASSTYGSLNKGMYSEDGTTWTGLDAYPKGSNRWFGVTYGNGKFVAVAWYGTDKIIYTEDDGETWTGISSHDGNSWHGVTYGDGKFVAVAHTGSNRIICSEDAIDWTTVSAHDANNWRSVTYGVGSDGVGRFVAVGGSGTNRVIYSEDGINWTGVSGHDANEWQSVIYGNGKFVAVAYTGSNRAMYSENGVNWTSVNTESGESNSWHAVTYGNGYFVAVSNTAGATNKVMYSEDGGKTWVSMESSNEDNGWAGIAYGNGNFVAVAHTGWQNKSMVIEAPKGPGNLYFNDDPVVVDRGQTKALARSVSSFSSRFGTSRFYTSEEPSDSFGIDNGTLWLNPSNAKLSIYYDSDWNQLN